MNRAVYRLRHPGSSITAALGNVSAAGIGSPELDVTQSGGGPKAFVANQSKGNVGGTTSSKSSPRPTSWEQRPGHGVGLGVAQAAGLSNQPDALSSPEADPSRAIACEETMSPDTIMPAAINKVTQSTFRNRLSVNERFAVSILAAGYNQRFYQHCGAGCQFRRIARRHSRHATRVKRVSLVRGETAGASSAPRS